MVRDVYSNVMKYLIVILLLLLYQITSAQLPQLDFGSAYPSAKVVENSRNEDDPKYASGNVYTSAVFTSNPRVEGDYYLVDIYLARGGVKDPNDFKSLVNEIWESASVRDCGGKSQYSSVGGFGVSFQKVGPSEITFGDIFDTRDKKFILNPLLESNDPQCPTATKFNSLTLGANNLSVGFNKNEEGREQIFYAVRLEAHTPLFAGTFKLKIKDKKYNSSLKLVVSACAASVWGGLNYEKKCSIYTAVGWLDGKDPNISLGGEPEKVRPPKPEIVAPAESQLCLGSGQKAVSYAYSVASPKDTVEYNWFVSSTANPKLPVGNTMATWAKATADYSTVKVNWMKAGTYLLNSYVVSKSSKLSSDTVSRTITIFARPQAVLSFNQSQYLEGDNITATVQGGTQQYWLKPTEVTSPTFTVNNVAANSKHDFQAYVKDANGCKDTTELKSISIGAKPKLLVDADSLFQLCTNGATVLRLKSVTDEGGVPVNLAGCTVTWTLGATVLTPNADKTLSVVNPGVYQVKVVNTNSTPAAEGTDIVNVTVKSVPAPVLSGNVFTVKDRGTQTVIEAVVTNPGTGTLKWNWSPAAFLDNTKIARPMTTNSTANPLPADANPFTVYVEDDNHCRSKDMTVTVNVNNTNGLNLKLEPASLEICKGNKANLVAKLNNVVVPTGYTYTWEPAGMSVNGPQAVYTAATAWDGYIYVTATATGGFKAMTRMQMKVKDFTAPILQKGPELAHCLGDKITVSSTPSSANNFVWLKNGTVDNANKTNAYAFHQNGTYAMSVTVKDANCVSDSVSWPAITIKTAPVVQPLALKSANTVLCGDKDVLVLKTDVTTPDSIKWYKGGVMVAEGKNQKELNITGGGVYRATAWVGVCFATTPDLTVNQTPMPKLNSLVVSDSCGQAVMIADASNATTYVWAPAGTVTSSMQGVKSVAKITADKGYNTYTVQLTLKNGTCQVDTTFRAKLLQKPEIALAAGDMSKHCAEEVLTVSATPAMTGLDYSWYKGNSLTANKSDRYVLAANVVAEKIEVIAKATNGCKDTVGNNFRVYPKPVLDWDGMMPPDVAVVDGERIDVRVLATGGTGLYTYHFVSPYATQIDNQTGSLTDGQQYVADRTNSPAKFFIRVEDQQGCKDTLTKSVGIIGVPLDVEIVSRHGDYICANGSAILSARVTKGVGTLTYEWYKKSNPTIVLGRDSVLIVQHLVASEMLNPEYGYGVRVVCPATTGEGGAELTLHFNGATPPEAPAITADPKLITIRQSAATVLAATLDDDYAGKVNWFWTPENLASAAESSKQYPLTKALMTANSETNFDVYVVDPATRCVSNIERVVVKTNNSTGLKIQIDPENPQLCKNNSIGLKATILYPTNATGATFSWTSEGQLTAASGQSTRFTTDENTVAGDYLQVVRVTNNGVTALARNTVTVKSDLAPKLEFDEGTDRFCSGREIAVTNSGNLEAENGGFMWIVDGTATPGSNIHSFPVHGKYDVKVTARSFDNSCWSDTLSATVFRTPVINTFTPSQTVQQNQVVNLVATVTPTTGMKGAWTSLPAGKFGGIASTEPKLTANTVPMQENVDYTYTIKNTEEPKCSADTTITINIKTSDFAIKVAKDSISVCAGEELAVQVDPSDMGESVTYRMTSDSPDFLGMKTVANIVGRFMFSSKTTATQASFTTPGSYQLFFEATDSKMNIARDTLKFTVRPLPTISIDKSGTAQLCVGSGSTLPIVMTLGGGNPWTVKYSLNGAEQTIHSIGSTYHTINMTSAGLFKILSVVNGQNCAISSGLPQLTIEDITPKAEFAAVTTDSICLPTDKTHKLALKLEGKLDYPLTLFYRKDAGTTQTQRILTNGAEQILLADGGTGVYYLDSVRNNPGCSSPTRSAAATKELRQFKAGVPDIRFATNSTGLCAGSTIQIPLTVNGGTPEYTLRGTLNGQVSFTLTAGQRTITVNQSGVLNLTSITDRNGCVDGDLSNVQVVIADWAKPVLTLSSGENSFGFCGGNGTAVLPIKVSGGDPDWKIYYKVGTTSYQETITDRNWSWTVDQPGRLVVDSVVNDQGCRGVPTDALLTGVTIHDDRPTAEFANAEVETICGGTAEGSPINLTVKTGVWPVAIWYHKVDGGSFQEMIQQASVALKITETGSYVLDSIRNNDLCKGTVKTTEKVIKNGSLDLAVELVATEGVLCKGTGQLDIPLKFTGTALANDATRKFTVSYSYTPVSGTAVAKSLSDVLMSAMFAGQVKITDAPLGQYQLTAVTENGGCSGVVSDVPAKNTVNVGTLPAVDIDSVDFMARKGQEFVLGVKNPNGGSNDYEWQKLPGGSFATVTTPFTVNGTMADADLKYRLRAIDRVSKCANMDSVKIFRIPEPPVVKIDTNTNRNNLKISWTPSDTDTDAVIDGYVVKHNLWDAYALENQYTTKRSFNNGGKEASLPLATNELDTLEFFYVQAYRSVSLNGVTKTFNSVSSDTVGYYKSDIKVNESKPSQNMFAVYFDFSKMGIKNTEALFKRLSPANVSFIRKFTYETQLWVYARQTTGGGIINDFDIDQGLVLKLQVERPSDKTVFIQYGKLPSRYAFSIKNSNVGKSNLSYGFMLPQKLDSCKTSKDILKELNSLDILRKWNFENQLWDYSRLPSPSVCIGEFSVREMLMIFQFQLKANSNTVEWK